MAHGSLIPALTIWRDYSLPPYKDLTWSLTHLQSICLLAMLAILLSYIQTRLWIITRAVLIRILHPIRLSDSDKSSIERLSQPRALKRLFSKKVTLRDGPMTSISPWFGLASLCNTLLFIALGAAIPFLLTGGPGPSRVRAKHTNQCQGLPEFSPHNIEMAEYVYAQCLLGGLDESGDCGVDSGIVPVRPKLDFTSVPDDCPFPEVQCLINSESHDLRYFCENDTRYPECEGQTLVTRVAYHDVTPSDYGLNVDRRIRQSHRLTCAPIRTDRYIVPYFQIYNQTAFWLGYRDGSYNPRSTHDVWATDHIGHRSIWGEVNRIKYLRDGTLVRQDNRTGLGPWEVRSTRLYQMFIYPVLVPRQPHMGSVYVNVNPNLNRENGDAFVTMLMYGQNLPYYDKGDTIIWLSSRERLLGSPDVTITYTLGCFEQYRLCFGKDCAEWSNSLDALHNISDILHSSSTLDTKSMGEFLDVYTLLVQLSSVRNYLSYRHREEVTLRSLMHKAPALEAKFNQIAQWGWEVTSWFEISFLMTKFNLMGGVAGELRSPYPFHATYHYNSTDWICNKLLFQYDNHVNVDVVRLLGTLSALLCLWLVSVLKHGVPIPISRYVRRFSAILKWDRGTGVFC
ncbi:uncharacterized protein BJX67DRAFT_342710 [Aspergillus lucknowensis]|uniref:Uncharacterized protein n=1 Tax=Aspergillus lucknowensis TaxID=176173 RepID=A0ABR4M4T0_9EURO